LGATPDVLTGDDAFDARDDERAGGVDRQDLRVGVRRAAGIAACNVPLGTPQVVGKTGTPDQKGR
jgi:hypothetical protein